VHRVLAQRGQDADHHQVAADVPGLGVPGVQAAADLGLQPGDRVAGQLPGRHVDLQVELAQLGGPGRVRDRLQHVGVAHGRPALVIDQVQLDFQPDLSGVGLEQVLAEHPGEYVQRPAHLVPVLPPVFTADRDQLDVATHLASASQG
jgi:hypothetical protein